MPVCHCQQKFEPTVLIRPNTTRHDLDYLLVCAVFASVSDISGAVCTVHCLYRVMFAFLCPCSDKSPILINIAQSESVWTASMLLWACVVRRLLAAVTAAAAAAAILVFPRRRCCSAGKRLSSCHPSSSASLLLELRVYESCFSPVRRGWIPQHPSQVACDRRPTAATGVIVE